MPHLTPQTLTEADQTRLRRASAASPRDHLIFSLAPGTGLCVAAIVGLNVGDVFFPYGAPRDRVCLRRVPAKRHRAKDEAGTGNLATASALALGVRGSPLPLQGRGNNPGTALPARPRAINPR